MTSNTLAPTTLTERQRLRVLFIKWNQRSACAQTVLPYANGETHNRRARLKILSFLTERVLRFGLMVSTLLLVEEMDRMMAVQLPRRGK